MKTSHGIVVFVGALAAMPAAAVQILPVSYAMPNGDGTANGGGFNYWDRSYTGIGSTTTDGAALSGGLGKLTDGVVATGVWNTTANAAGTGEHVGWFTTINPVITFTFSGAPGIDTITLDLDNSGIGGVYAPAAILIDGISRSFTAPSNYGAVSFSNLGLTGNLHTIELQQEPGRWVFLSEASFDGTPGSVPEPISWAMMVAGFGIMGGALRRQRSAIALI